MNLEDLIPKLEGGYKVGKLPQLAIIPSRDIGNKTLFMNNFYIQHVLQNNIEVEMTFEIDEATLKSRLKQMGYTEKKPYKKTVVFDENKSS